MWELKSEDACIEGSAEFSDYREQLVTWDAYMRMDPTNSGQVSLAIARATDQSFPENEAVRLENGAPVLTKLPRKAEAAKLHGLEKTIAA
jgi:hypothetical protein